MKRYVLSLLIVLIAAPCFSADFTVCSSGCDATSVAAVFSANDLSAGDNTITVSENIAECIAWPAADSGTSGHPNILQGSSQSISITCSGGTYPIDLSSVDYVTVQNITLVGGNTACLYAGSGQTGQKIANVTAQSGADDGTGADFYINGGGTDIVVSNVSSSNSGQDGLYIAGAFTNSSLSGFTVDGAVRNGILASGATGITISNGVITDSDSADSAGGRGLRQLGGTLSITGVVSSGSGGEPGFEVGSAGTMTLYGCESHSNGEDGFFTTGASTLIAYYCSAHNNGTKESNGYGDGFTSHEGDSLTMYFCQSYANANTGVAVGRLSSDAARALTVVNCSFFNNGTASDAIFDRDADIWIGDGGEIALVVEHVATSASEYAFILNAAAVTDGFAAGTCIDRNLYDAAGGQKFSYNGSDQTFTQWKTDLAGGDADITGDDANSMDDDPDYASPAGGLALALSSPCVNAGLQAGDISLTGFNTDILGANRYFAPYDHLNIGADQSYSDAANRGSMDKGLGLQ